MNETLQIIELFASVQGETSLTGFPTAFIRLARCNLRCTWCDTTYSFGRGTTWTLEAILAKVKEMGCLHVCVTGGEPLLQKNVHPLLKTLCDEKYIVSLETGGSLSTAEIDPRVRIILDIKCPGSGMEGKNLWSNLPLLRAHDEVKFVLCGREDYDYAAQICQKYNLYKRVFPPLLSPVHTVLNPQTLIAWILEDKWPVRLNLQIHKYIWTPTTQGV